MNIEEIKNLKTFDERYKYNIDEAIKTKEIKIEDKEKMNNEDRSGKFSTL